MSNSDLFGVTSSTVSKYLSYKDKPERTTFPLGVEHDESRETPEVVAPEDAATLNYCRNFAAPRVWTGGIPTKEGADRRPPVVVVWTGGLGSPRLHLAGVWFLREAGRDEVGLCAAAVLEGVDRSNNNKEEALMALAEAGRSLESLEGGNPGQEDSGIDSAAVLGAGKSGLLSWLLRFGGFKERLLADDLFLAIVTMECDVGIFTKNLKRD
nr:protein RETICULATA-RELATED 4, chloroplastic-like [Ipomoea batatas]